jgi:hypothetical protein
LRTDCANRPVLAEAAVDGRLELMLARGMRGGANGIAAMVLTVGSELAGEFARCAAKSVRSAENSASLNQFPSSTGAVKHVVSLSKRRTDSLPRLKRGDLTRRCCIACRKCQTPQS